MSHTQACLDRQAKIRAEIAAYNERWPNHCQECGGVGGFWGYTGDGRNEPREADFDICNECVGKDICPRCGQVTAEIADNDKPCQHCGWKATDTGAPPEFDGDCGCDDGSYTFTEDI